VKLIIQIPCFNEAETLSIALAALPRKVHGFDEVEWLIINDGSTDDTIEVAKECGVDHIVSFKYNQGLAKGFMAGISECLRQGAE
jgi:glycosyltransferase involved in cell wall biosynthesis